MKPLFSRWSALTTESRYHHVFRVLIALHLLFSGISFRASDASRGTAAVIARTWTLDGFADVLIICGILLLLHTQLKFWQFVVLTSPIIFYCFFVIAGLPDGTTSAQAFFNTAFDYALMMTLYLWMSRHGSANR